jgi:hypothetical protein
MDRCGQLLDVIVRAMDHIARDILDGDGHNSIYHRMKVLRFYFASLASQRLHLLPDNLMVLYLHYHISAVLLTVHY